MDALGKGERLDRRLDRDRFDAAGAGDHSGAFGRFVTGNIMALVKSLGDAGLVGLTALGVILWLFSSRKTA